MTETWQFRLLLQLHQWYPSISRPPYPAQQTNKIDGKKGRRLQRQKTPCLCNREYPAARGPSHQSVSFPRFPYFRRSTRKGPLPDPGSRELFRYPNSSLVLSRVEGLQMLAVLHRPLSVAACACALRKGEGATNDQLNLISVCGDIQHRRIVGG